MMSLVIAKKSATYSIPEGVLDVAAESFARLADGKSKWSVVSAAMLMFAAMSPDEAAILVGRVRASEHDDYAMETLVKAAKSGELRNWLAAEVANRAAAQSTSPSTGTTTNPSSKGKRFIRLPSGATEAAPAENTSRIKR